MKSEMKRWKDRKIFFGSEHVSSQIWCYLKLVRWDEDEENEQIFFGSEHVSSQIWCYLKLVRWRDEEWDEWTDEEKFFLVRTCIKPNLVLSEISEMSEMNRWRKIFFWVWTCIKPNLVLSEISEMKSEMKRWTDEEKIFFGLNMYQAKSGVIWN